MPYKDKEKQRRYWREWYRNNPEKAKEYYRKKAKKRRREIRSWYERYKQGLSCSRCKEDDSICLEFHHTDPNKKDFNISQMRAQAYSINRIKQEISKCLVLCSNCHKKEHARIRQKKKQERR